MSNTRIELILFFQEILRIEVPCYSNPEQIHDSSKMQQIMEDDMRRREDLHDTIKFINDNLSNVLKLFDPLQQHEIDENLVYGFF